MIRSLCALSATLILGTHLLPATEDTWDEEKKEPAFDLKKYEERNEIMRPLIDESFELSRSVASDRKHGRTPSDEALARLDELQAMLQKLQRLQSKEIQKLSSEVGSEAPEDPSDLYFRGWLVCRDAEKSKTAGNLADSREKLKKALEIFEQVAKEHPDWKPQIVQARLAKTKEELAALPSSGD